MTQDEYRPVHVAKFFKPVLSLYRQGCCAPSPPRSRQNDKPPIRVVVWDEQQPAQKQAYEDFLGNQIAGSLKKQPGLDVSSRRLGRSRSGDRRRRTRSLRRARLVGTRAAP